MSTDAGNAAAPEDAATRDVASERPGMESADPDAADSATSTPETADRGVEGSSDLPDRDTSEPDRDTGPADADDTGSPTPDPGNEGFLTTMLRDATITGLPGETGAPPEEPHAPEAQQRDDEPVGGEGSAEDERNG